jgi:hypothetical protein
LGVVGVRDGQKGFITASHCSEKMFEQDNTPFYQPSSSIGSYFVGNESYDRRYYRCGFILPQWKCRGSDATFIAINTDIELGRIARTRRWDGSLEINPNNPAFLISSVASTAIKNDVVDAVGASSGWTWGRVQ